MVYLAMSPWDGMWKNRHQLMSRFARQMPVLYVEPWQRLRQLRRNIGAEGLSLFRGKGPIVKRASPNLHVFSSPACLPVSGSKLLGGVTKRRWLRAVRQAATSVGITNVVLWVSLPEMRFALGRLDESLSIYHIVDEYGGYTGNDTRARKSMWSEEEKLLDQADLTIVVSPELLESKSGNGRTVELIENGVDFLAFKNAVDATDLPDDCADIPRPRLGYCGLIGKRLDLDLLHYLATHHSDWSIVLVGKVDERDCEAKLKLIRRLENVHFLGQKHFSQVPKYVASFDIGLLPYQLNLETRNISPLKLYEYLAAGKRVVATDIPAARRHDSLLSVCPDRESFTKQCERYLSSEIAGPEQTRLLEYAASNTWEQRVDQISHCLLMKLPERMP